MSEMKKINNIEKLKIFFSNIDNKYINKKHYAYMISMLPISIALEYLSEMKKKLILPDIVIYNSLIQKDIVHYNKYLIMIKEDGIPLNGRTYSILINGIKDYHLVLILYEKMINDKIQIDQTIYASLIKISSEFKARDDMLFFCEKILATKDALDLVSYNTIIKAFFDIGDKKNAKIYWKKMLDDNHLPNSISYGLMLDSYANNNDFDLFDQLWDELIGKNINPDWNHMNAYLLKNILYYFDNFQVKSIFDINQCVKILEIKVKAYDKNFLKKNGLKDICRASILNFHNIGHSIALLLTLKFIQNPNQSIKYLIYGKGDGILFSHVYFMLNKIHLPYLHFEVNAEYGGFTVFYE